MPVFKTYNLKLNEESYFKLRQIEINLEKTEKKKLTKSQVIAIIIDKYKQMEFPKKHK